MDNLIDTLKRISFICDLLEKKQYSLALLELEKFLFLDFPNLHSNESLQDNFVNIIKYYVAKKTNIGENKEILLFSLQKIKEFILQSLALQDFEKFKNIDLSLSLVDINEIIHSYIFKNFEKHFECLFKGEYNESLKWWNNLEFYLDKHSYIEDTIIEPIYISSTAKLGTPRGGEYKHFIYEHKMLKKFSKNIEELLEKGQIIEKFTENIDLYFYFKNFWIHHGLREKNIFYKFLEDVLQDDVKQELKLELVKSIKEWEF
ncbi:MAG: hypothetical protein ACK4GR_02540 [bacterium]